MAVGASFLLRDARDTRALGRAVGRAASPGWVVALVGPLGAGKTTFVQGLAEGLGVPRDARVRSPTFTLVDEHPGRLPLRHIDFYRLGDPDELEDLGGRELMGGEGVCAVEWADRFPGEVPGDALWVRIAYAPGGGRVAELMGPPGPLWDALSRAKLRRAQAGERSAGGGPPP